MNFKEAIAKIRKESLSNRERGDCFEKIAKTFFQQDPHFKDLFAKVWQWHEWPDRDGQDTDIDLVAQRARHRQSLGHSMQVLRTASLPSKRRHRFVSLRFRQKLWQKRQKAFFSPPDYFHYGQMVFQRRESHHRPSHPLPENQRGYTSRKPGGMEKHPQTLVRLTESCG